jgi:MYXO-CTERM domain-containing protein
VITYQWSQTSGPAGSFTGGTTSATATFVAGSTAGNVTIGLTVTDAKGLSNAASKSVTVSAPAPKDEGGCNSTGTPASALAALLVGVFFLARRRRTV